MQITVNTLLLLLGITFLFQRCMEPSEDIPCEFFTLDIVQDGNNVLKAQPKGGTEPYSFEWSSGENLTRIKVSSSGTYSVTVTDNYGCILTASMNITYIPECSPATVADADGNSYDVVTIGGQCWMQQNLQVTFGIPQVTDSVAWTALTTPAWCIYANSSGYGKLYNWAAVQAGNLCPAGWHIPTLDDWNELITYLGGQSIAGGKMKDTSHWESPNTQATNSSGFTAYGSGYRATNGSFWDEFRIAAFWTGTTYAPDTAQAWAVTLNYQYALASAGWSPKKSGYSCRCIKD